MNLTPGEWYALRIGSSEFPKMKVAEYCHPSSDLPRFHIFMADGEPMTIHDSNIIGEHEAPRPKA